MSAHHRPSVSLVITDLDNTLWDWVTFFVESLQAMLEVAAPMLGVTEDELATDMREVHERHRNSEHPFALIETRAVRVRFPDLSRKERARALDEAFYAFNSRRKETLSLYPGVLETLGELERRNVPVVGHTEATVPNALFRLGALGVAPHLRKLYAIEPVGPGHPDPSAETTRAPVDIEVRYLSERERKPAPGVIAEICREFAVPPGRALYVGDSIARDMAMAREAGARSAWARYGTNVEASLWDRLVRVTHWTPDAVARAQATRKDPTDAEPDVVLERSFAEILERFGFG